MVITNSTKILSIYSKMPNIWLSNIDYIDRIEQTQIPALANMNSQCTSHKLFNHKIRDIKLLTM